MKKLTGIEVINFMYICYMYICVGTMVYAFIVSLTIYHQRESVQEVFIGMPIYIAISYCIKEMVIKILSSKNKYIIINTIILIVIFIYNSFCISNLFVDDYKMFIPSLFTLSYVILNLHFIIRNKLIEKSVSIAVIISIVSLLVSLITFLFNK